MDEGDHVLAVLISRLTSRFDTMESAQSREECGVIFELRWVGPFRSLKGEVSKRLDARCKA